MKQLISRAGHGALAGLLATAAMSLVMLGAKRLGALGEPPPRRLVRRITAGLGPAAPRGRALDAAALAAHFAFGASVGTLFGLFPPTARTSGGGALYGLGVWAVNYAGWLPKVGLMPPARRDRPGRQPAMIVAHLVFGAALAVAHRRLWSNLESLRGKVVVVAGGTRGLGLAVARELLRHGARVAICGRSRPSVERARSSLSALPGAIVMADTCDLRSEPQTRDFFERVTRELGPIDVAVANAATISVGPLESLTLSDFELAMLNVFGTALRTTMAVLPGMRKRCSGSIVMISSIGGKLGLPHLAPYSAAKFAQVGFAEALHAEVAQDGVRVLTVVPGLMRTGSHVHARFSGDSERELQWFGASAVAPLLSIDPDRAARRVVRAIARGDRFLTFTPAARVGGWLHDVAPNAWSLLFAIVGRLLPSIVSRPAHADEGQAILDRSSSRWSRLIAWRTAPLLRPNNQ
jgi:NAD(P)-dependent dehydrogenase (short-subunit alcohol dehydrogenase family)